MSPTARPAPSPLTGGLRRRFAAGTAALTIFATGAVALVSVEAAGAATTIHVAPSGTDDAPGTADAPVRTVGRAVKLASAGDRVEIAGGTYHEEVQVYGKELHLAAAPGAAVVFDGAVPVDGWSAADGDWFASWHGNFARAGEPHTLPERPEAGWPEQFFVDGVALTEVTSREAVVAGTFFNDIAGGRVWIGDDPTGRLVEGSDLAWALYLNRADGSSVTGITARRYATPIGNMAAIRAYADNLVLRGVTVEDNAYMGLSAMGTNISIDALTARRNGHLGAHGHRCSDLSITNSTIVGNNAEWFNFHHAAGGFKVTESNGVVVTGSTVSGNGGPGIWTDLSTSNITVANNLVQGNSRTGIMLELSSAATVVNNASTGNAQAGIWVLESSDVRVWHNAAFGNFRDVWILDGPRSDVFDVDVINNTFGGGSLGAQAVLSVDDWTKDRSTAEMDLAMAGNRYWLPVGSPTPYISRFANWPSSLSLSTTIDEHRTAAGLDGDATFSDAAANPFVRSPATGDHRQPADAPGGHPIIAEVASVVGIPAGTSFPAGPLTAFGATAEPAPSAPTPPADGGAAPSGGTEASGTASPATASPATAPDVRRREILPAVRLETTRGSTASVGSITDAEIAPAPAPAPAAETAPIAAPAEPIATDVERPAVVGWHELATAASSDR